nr:hypothetical protein [Tanacetum cinerariifolium]
MHNNIMAAGFRDRPPMLATERYPQWHLRFLRYLDTRPNGEALRKCIMSGPYKPTTILVQAREATDDSPAIPEHTTVETPMNMSPENKAHFLAEKEAIHLILTGIGDEIYSTVDACQTAQEIWEAIERFYKLMNEMIRNNLTVTTMQVNVQFLQQLQPEWSTFVTIVKQQHKLDEVSYHKLFDILKQYQNEVNELCVERLARNANPLSLVAIAQANQDLYYQTSRSHKSHTPSSKPLILTRSHTTTRHKGKEIAKPITPPSEIYKPTNNNLRTSSNSRNKNVDTTLWYKNDDHSGQFRNQRTVNVARAREKECRKPKRVKDSAYHNENMLQAEQGVPLQVEQYDWIADTDEEVDEQELEAHYSYMEKIQEQSESVSNTCLVETDDSNVIPDSPDICEDDIQNDQNDVESDDERVALANLIANLKLDVDENKNIQKQLKKANTTLAQELKECKAILGETSKTCTVWNENASNFFRNEREQYIKIQDLKAQLQDKNIAVSELKIIIEKGKGKSVDTKFDRPSVVRQSNAQRIPKPSVLCKLTPFSNSLDRIYFPKTKSVLKTNVSKSLSKPVTVQTLPQTARQAVSNTNVLKPRMYRIDNRTAHSRAPQLPQTFRNTNPCVSTSTEVNHKPNVSRPQHKCNQSRDKVLPHNSQVKIVQLILFIVNSGCTKHMTSNLKLLCNFVEKFMGLNHNLFSVGQFCDADLENQHHQLHSVSWLRTHTKSSMVMASKAFSYQLRLYQLAFKEGYRDWPTKVEASDYDNPDPIPQRQDVSSSADAHVPSQQELDLLFGPLYDEFFNAGSNPQDKQPTMNIPSTSAPSTPTNVHVEENTDNQAEEGEHLQDDEFTNPFCAPAQKEAESSSHNIGNSNVPTFNQP